MLRISDFADVATWRGFVHVAFVIDAFGGGIPGWRVRRTAHANFVLAALEQAVPRSGRMPGWRSTRTRDPDICRPPTGRSVQTGGLAPDEIRPFLLTRRSTGQHGAAGLHRAGRELGPLLLGELLGHDPPSSGVTPDVSRLLAPRESGSARAWEIRRLEYQPGKAVARLRLAQLL